MPKSSIQRTLKGLAIAYLLEAAVLYAATVATISALFVGETISVLTTLALAAIFLGVAIWLTAAAKAISKGKRWARSAGIFWQLIQIAVALGTIDYSILWALAMAIPSLAVLITLFNKDVVSATAENRNLES